MYPSSFLTRRKDGKPMRNTTKLRNRNKDIKKEIGTHLEVVEFSSKTADMPAGKAKTMKTMAISIKNDDSIAFANTML